MCVVNKDIELLLAILSPIIWDQNYFYVSTNVIFSEQNNLSLLTLCEILCTIWLHD